jgi:hypothetical protein
MVYLQDPKLLTEYRTIYSQTIADCDLWLDAAKALEEQSAMVDRVKAAIANAPDEALSDDERATLNKLASSASTQKGASTEQVLFAILEAARRENEELRAKIAATRQEPCSDAPIADPVERAKAVSKELRSRGLRATATVRTDGVTIPNPFDHSGREDSYYDPGAAVFCGKGPSAIADWIQENEARQAREWAGDK